MRSADLPGTSDPIWSLESQGARAVDRGQRQRLLRRERAGIAGHRLGEQSRHSHLAEQVEAVVAGRTVGSEGDVDAGRQQAATGRRTAGELEVGRRAMHHAGVCRSASSRISSSETSVMCTAMNGEPRADRAPRGAPAGACRSGGRCRSTSLRVSCTCMCTATSSSSARDRR